MLSKAGCQGPPNLVSFTNPLAAGSEAGTLSTPNPDYGQLENPTWCRAFASLYSTTWEHSRTHQQRQQHRHHQFLKI